ncbi:hypothetical protein EVAR_98231_1 [Eumeta japonica]|uniref:Uncharacterized protein n=1 Tax=Eumeta variegata TaxID=151549 RepID=A0A4C1XYS0_EUMVA|nr:hypothetical protein EVAR_98231_1 [Eumeta japonica]
MDTWLEFRNLQVHNHKTCPARQHPRASSAISVLAPTLWDALLGSSRPSGPHTLSKISIFGECPGHLTQLTRVPGANDVKVRTCAARPGLRARRNRARAGPAAAPAAVRGGERKP